jgi:APA family basic amino acid/polyamine antiporter
VYATETKPPSSHPSVPSAPLVRALGLWDSVALIMGIMIGSGIFLMAGSIAVQLRSIAAVIAVWAFGGVLSLCGAVSLSELGAALPSAGGLYVYLARAFGPGTGFVYGWSAMAAIGLYLEPILGLSPVQQRLIQLACIAVFVAVNSVGVRPGKWTQNVLTSVKVLGLVVMTLLLYTRGNTTLLLASWAPTGGAPSFVSFGVALLAVLWAYDGWHFISFAAGEVKNPSRTIPRSLLVGTVLTLAIYLLVNVAYYMVLTPGEIRGTDRVAAAAVQHVFGAKASLLISLLIAISILGAINGIVLGAARVSFAMAKDGLFFRSFARVNTRFHTPVVATVAQGIFAGVFTLVGTFRQLFTSYVFTSWIFYGLAVATVIVLRRREPTLPRPYRCPGYPYTPLFFVAGTAAIVVTTFVADFWHALTGVGLILAGIPLYLVFRAVNARHVTEA